MIRLCSLQSGSNGNSVLVQTPDACLLIDAGISGRQARMRLEQRDIDADAIDALLITHDHSDHVRSAGIFHRKFQLPLYMTQGTYDGAVKRLGKLRNEALSLFSPGQVLAFQSTTVETVPTAHDGSEGVAYIISYEGRKLGIFTDLGHGYAGLDAQLNDLDALFIESNYDPDMLEQGPYPYWLKQRIRGDGGHLSNLETAELLKRINRSYQWVVLAHLSEHNNQPDLAYGTVREIVGEGLPLHLASRYDVGPVYVLE